MHMLLLGHETPVRNANVAPEGKGVDTIDHDVPLNRSTRGWKFPGEGACAPTAWQSVAVTHEMLFSRAIFPVVPAAKGLGLDSAVQLVPSHRATSVYDVSCIVGCSLVPTARHAVLLTHETENSRAG
jgi:hypothetical protein